MKTILSLTLLISAAPAFAEYEAARQELAPANARAIALPAKIAAYRIAPTQVIIYGDMSGRLANRLLVDVTSDDAPLYCSFRGPNGPTNFQIEAGTEFLLQGPGKQWKNKLGETVQEFPALEARGGQAAAHALVSLVCFSRGKGRSLLEMSPKEFVALMQDKSFTLKSPDLKPEDMPAPESDVIHIDAF